MIYILNSFINELPIEMRFFANFGVIFGKLSFFSQYVIDVLTSVT